MLLCYFISNSRSILYLLFFFLLFFIMAVAFVSFCYSFLFFFCYFNQFRFVQSIDALADALDEFTGGVVLVSHDSRLISRVCEDEERSEIWVVENGKVRKYPASFEEYKEELIKEIIEEVES